MRKFLVILCATFSLLSCNENSREKKVLDEITEGRLPWFSCCIGFVVSDFLSRGVSVIFSFVPVGRELQAYRSMQDKRANAEWQMIRVLIWALSIVVPFIQGTGNSTHNSAEWVSFLCLLGAHPSKGLLICIVSLWGNFLNVLVLEIYQTFQ